jgi:hypothetical protein
MNDAKIAAYVRRIGERVSHLDEAGADKDATPQQTLVRAAETGQFEAIVAKAQPAEPPTMVTPEEREAELRASGRWPEPKPDPAPAPAEPAAAAEPERELTPPMSPGEQYVAETTRWSPRRAQDLPRRPYGQCLVEYDVFTGELIGDGYTHYDDEDEEW